MGDSFTEGTEDMACMMVDSILPCTGTGAGTGTGTGLQASYCTVGTEDMG